MKGMSLPTREENVVAQNNLRDCTKDCLENKQGSSFQCRSVLKNIQNNGCVLTDKRSDDTGVQTETNSLYQYFNRPTWYLGMNYYVLSIINVIDII